MNRRMSMFAFAIVVVLAIIVAGLLLRVLLNLGQVEIILADQGDLLRGGRASLNDVVETERLFAAARADAVLISVFGLFVAASAMFGGYVLARLDADADRRSGKRFAALESRLGAAAEMLTDGASPQARATAAGALGRILETCADGGGVSRAQQALLAGQTKAALAAALALETDAGARAQIAAAVRRHAAGRGRGAAYDLAGVDFSRARAEQANWADIDATEANFFDARLDGTILRGARLDGARFHGTQAPGAVFAGATGKNVVIAGADFKGADFSNAAFTGARINDAGFDAADLRGADFAGATFDGVSFDGAKVHGCRAVMATAETPPAGIVDVSPGGDGSKTLPAAAWFSEASAAPPAVVNKDAKDGVTGRVDDAMKWLTAKRPTADTR